jgi:heme-degrading monooxygenase HmoA
MFVSLAIHRPKPGAEPGLIEAMHRFGVAAHGAPGLQRIHTLQSATDGFLVGLAIWDSEDAFHSARVWMRAAIADVDFTSLEDVGPEVYLLVEV